MGTVLHSVHRKETRRATRVEAQCEAGVWAKQIPEYEEAEALSPHTVLPHVCYTTTVSDADCPSVVLHLYMHTFSVNSHNGIECPDHAGSQVFNCTLWKNKAKQDSNVSRPPKSPPQQSTPTVSPPPSLPPPGSLILDSAVVLGGVCPKQWAYLAGFLDGELEDVGFALPCACIDVLD